MWESGGDECQDALLWQAVALLDALWAASLYLMGSLVWPEMTVNTGDIGEPEIAGMAVAGSSNTLDKGKVKPLEGCLEISVRSHSSNCRDEETVVGGVVPKGSMWAREGSSQEAAFPYLHESLMKFLWQWQMSKYLYFGFHLSI